MTLKSLFFTLCLMLTATFSFAATDAVTPADDQVSIEVVDMEAPAPVISINDVTEDDASCTVTATVSAFGQTFEVSATARTCGAAMQMIVDIL